MAPRKQQKPRKPRSSFKKRVYTDDERVAVLVLLQTNGGNVNKTSTESGVPEPTIRCWVNGWRYPEAMQIYEAKRGDLSKAFEELAWHAVKIAGDKANEAPFNHLMTGAGIAVDKMRLLRGEPSGYQQNDNRNVNLNLAAIAGRLNPEQRRQLESLLRIALGDDGTGPVEGANPVHDSRASGELLQLPASGVSGERSVQDIQG